MGYPRAVEERTSAAPVDDARAVYDAYGAFVWMTLHRMGVAPSDVEDLCQEVFLVVHRRLDSYDPRAPMTAWLFGICLKVTAAYRRRAHRRREQPVESVEGPLPAGQDPEGLFVAHQRRRQLQALLATLDPEHRAVFVMFEIDELPCQQIAALIGIPVGTVYSRLHVARRRLAAAAARNRDSHDEA